VDKLTSSQDSGGLHCPYTQCGKRFDKPIVLTDTTKILRETYYACPHCHLKLEVSVDKSDGGLISIEATHNPVDIAPANCKHYFGYLRLLDESAQIPDECAICPKVMQCFVKKSQGIC
jgi:DNA-directed RNA polymerase subunit RPC12/RpoP